jgi:hypothetical protein
MHFNFLPDIQQVPTNPDPRPTQPSRTVS